MILKRALKYSYTNIRKSSTQRLIDEKYPSKVFSGIQPTGSIHIGNYLGAISQWVKLQERNEDLILSIVDLHSITLPHNPTSLSRNILELTATLLGCGINPDKVILFQQSTVHAHAELCWCLGCISTMARLAHLPQYKEKSATLKNIPLGLFVYPVLQAADILSYKATHVPVGEDQVQQIQFSQELARIFNKKFGETFPIPHTLITSTEYGRIKSLRDPSKKMSKSDPDEKSRICLNDSPDVIVGNIKKAVTDFQSEEIASWARSHRGLHRFLRKILRDHDVDETSLGPPRQVRLVKVEIEVNIEYVTFVTALKDAGMVTFDPEKRPGVSNLISIHSFVTGKSVDQICKDAEHLDTGRYKLEVADAVVSYVKPIQNTITQHLRDKSYLLNVLAQGAEKASNIANLTLKEVHEKLGMGVEHADKKHDSIKISS